MEGDCIQYGESKSCKWCDENNYKYCVPTASLEGMGEEEWTQIIHKECGLPVEFCECPDAPIKIIEEKN